MVNEEYLLMANNLVKRNQNRLNKKISAIEKETDTLFYWILRELEILVEKSWPPNGYHKITLKEPEVKMNNIMILVEKERYSEYFPKYVNKKEFYHVMENVTRIFNEIGEENHCFKAECYLPTTQNKRLAEINVSLITKSGGR